MTQDFIGTYDNIYSSEYCDNLINLYNSLEENGITWRRSDLSVEKNDGSMASGECYLHASNTFDLFTEVFWSQIYKEYSKKFSVLQTIDKHQIYHLKIQKTGIGEGYHTWHCENGSRGLSTRIMSFILYLNDVDDGGETEFLYYHKRIKPKKGTLILFPAGYPHTHRGNPPLNRTIYILTGWVEL